MGKKLKSDAQETKESKTMQFSPNLPPDLGQVVKDYCKTEGRKQDWFFERACRAFLDAEARSKAGV